MAYTYVPPGQVKVDSLRQLPAAVPVVSMLFRAGSRPDGLGGRVEVWIREM